MKYLLPFLITLWSLPALSQSGWFQQNSNTSYSLNAFYAVDANLVYIAGDNSKVIKTFNGGNSWTIINNGPYAFWSCWFVDVNTGYFGGASGDLLRTSNGGMIWTRPPHMTENLLHSIQFIDPNTGYFVGGFGTIYKTINGSASFFFQNSGTYNTLYSVCMLNATTGYIVGSGGKILKTLDGGNNWVNQNSLSSDNLYSVHFIDVNTGYACGGNISEYALKTTNGGISWVNVLLHIGPGGNPLNSVFFVNALTGYAVGTNGYILKTTSGGEFWSPQNSSTGVTLNEVKFINALTGYAVGNSGTILKTTDGGGPVGIIPISGEVPKDFQLYQNYPNPFNPVTRIRFAVSQFPLSKGGGAERRGLFVRLVIFDILGREIATLVNEPLSPGTYEVTWNADTYPSGTYFYRLSAGDFSATKKLMLVK